MVKNVIKHQQKQNNLVSAQSQQNDTISNNLNSEAIIINDNDTSNIPESKTTTLSPNKEENQKKQLSTLNGSSSHFTPLGILDNNDYNNLLEKGRINSLEFSDQIYLNSRSILSILISRIRLSYDKFLTDQEVAEGLKLSMTPPINDPFSPYYNGDGGKEIIKKDRKGKGKEVETETNDKKKRAEEKEKEERKEKYIKTIRDIYFKLNNYTPLMNTLETSLQSDRSYIDSILSLCLM